MLNGDGSATVYPVEPETAVPELRTTGLDSGTQSAEFVVVEMT
jgi:hypothetical protein